MTYMCRYGRAVDFKKRLFNTILESKRMPEDWRGSVLVLIFKNKGDVQNCSNYKKIKFKYHEAMGKIVQDRLRRKLMISEQH